MAFSPAGRYWLPVRGISNTRLQRFVAVGPDTQVTDRQAARLSVSPRADSRYSSFYARKLTLMNDPASGTASVIKYVVWLALVLALDVTAGYAQHANGVDIYVTRKMQEMHIPGLSLAVVKDGRVIKAAGYGLANLETNTPATAQTVYKTASLSKAVIAAAIMLLVQEGRVGLDDKISKYLENAPATWEGITIRRLLTHTSGLVRDPSDYHPYEMRPIIAIISDAYSSPLAFPPGEKWLYSNIGYYVLAEVITRASGKPWNEFIAERLFVPAHMTSTRLVSVTDIVPHRASGYHNSETGMKNAENWIAVRPSGAFLSSVLDLAKWDACLDSGSPLRGSSLDLMWGPAMLNNHTSVDYGFGWYVDSIFGQARIHHDGQFPGFQSDYERFQHDKLTVIILANGDNASVESLAIKVAGFYEPSLATPPFTLTAYVPDQPVHTGMPATVRITAKDNGHAAPDTLVEMEIWNAAGESVYKEHKENQNFTPGQEKTFPFSWTPIMPGTYTVNVGAYGPKWIPSYAWKVKAAMITITQ